MLVPLIIIIGFIVLIFLIWLIGNYNRFVRIRQHIRESWAGIDVELKRRYDLIPNLVSVVRGYTDHERDTLTRITDLRNQALASTGSASSQAHDESALMRELGRLFIVVENYPTLKADAHYLGLQNELADTEDRIAASRRFYNANIRDMRQLCEMFPTNLIASVFGFEGGEFFELASDAERVVPRVEFEDPN
jgi:LemA protein